MDDFHPAAFTFRAIYAAPLPDSTRRVNTIVSVNEVCLNDITFKLITNLQTTKNYKALLCSNSTNIYLVYDSRSAVFAKLGQNKRALEDARAIIRVAPE